MADTTICLKPINDLLNERFFVPSYQRGFRWKEQQVDDLLDDLWEFQASCKTKESFYCLQPVVVKKRPDGTWELVDGQQRLTTIYLILTYLKLFLEGLGKSRFGLTFETREDTCGPFLENIDCSKNEENIDYHHIYNAYAAIDHWFTGRDGSHRIKLLQCLTNDDESGRNVKVIWYELPVTEDPVHVFTRLNIGKIPLTNAELIRALFLQSGNFASNTVSLQQIKIAQEWDGIEKILQRDEVWHFLHNGESLSPNRIEYLFELNAREQTVTGPSEKDNFYTFRFYNTKLSSPNTKADEEWLQVKKYFMTLEEWFNDRTLYHLIGYLIHTGDDLLELRKVGNSVTKSAFRGILKARIFRGLLPNELRACADCESVKMAIEGLVSRLDYGENPKQIRSVLLLFNIATLLQNDASNLRFPFDSYEKEHWDIEHVRSVESGMPNNFGDQERWIKNAAECLNENQVGEDLCKRIAGLVAAKRPDGVQFERLYKDLLDRCGEKEATDSDNGLANLALLDRATNRSYKNALFPVKRKVILGRDRDGVFVPLCTKNVFLKCYSDKLNDMMFWSKEDSQSYYRAIVETLTSFFMVERGVSE